MGKKPGILLSSLKVAGTHGLGLSDSVASQGIHSYKTGTETQALQYRILCLKAHLFSVPSLRMKTSQVQDERLLGESTDLYSSVGATYFSTSGSQFLFLKWMLMPGQTRLWVKNSGAII